MLNFIKRHSQKIIAIILIALVIYALGRLYYQVTAGFSVTNITLDLSKEPNHGVKEISEAKQSEINQILNQPYHYLGKGCQSYVFMSEDGRYVIKFLKYQRYLIPSYVDFFSFIPSVKEYKQKKEAKKREKLDALLNSWTIAFNDLSPETGVIFLHLNPSSTLIEKLSITDKMGLSHEVSTQTTAFLVQKSATMLCKTLEEKMSNNDVDGAKNILRTLISMLLFEYARGFGDNDHALMQNTGMIGNQPLHIDVGQFSKEERFKDPKVYKEELFSKTYKFRIWLSKHYPELEKYLTEILEEVIGPEMQTMKPHLKTIDEGCGG